MTTHDFNDGRGPVPAHQHKNGGGWVADSARVDATVYVGARAQVFGTARVTGNALVMGDAQVTGNAPVMGNAQVMGDARVMGGFASPFHWTAWIDADGSYQLAIGCEIWPLEWWPTLLEEIAPEYGINADSNRATLESLCAFVASAFDRSTHGQDDR